MSTGPEKQTAKQTRYPVSLLKTEHEDTQTATLVARVEGSGLDAESGEEMTLSERQHKDKELAPILRYLQSGELPEGEKAARELVLGQSHYTVLDRVLYHVEPDKTLRIIPPTEDRHKLFLEVHEGPFSGHLREAKIVS